MRPIAIVAIVGSGPAGLYCADLLSRRFPCRALNLFERLGQPFGLLRYGVAPDHPGTRALMRVFERVLARPNVHLHAGRELGRDVSLEWLEADHAAVILATGAPLGRLPAYRGSEAAPAMSGIALAQWFNGHPEAKKPPAQRPVRSICIVGDGNVALDSARLLAKPTARLQTHGVPPTVLRWLEEQPLEEIHVCGRHGPADTRFSPEALEELGRLESFQPLVEDLGATTGANVQAAAVLQRFGRTREPGRRPMCFHFGVELAGWAAGEASFKRAGQPPLRLRADLVVHAIGQHAPPLAGLAHDAQRGCIAHTDGRIMGRDRVWAVGWAAGDGGLIAGSRRAAQALCERIAAALAAQGSEPQKQEELEI
jgi:ferredoxin--NADP+ reductase